MGTHLDQPEDRDSRRGDLEHLIEPIKAELSLTDEELRVLLRLLAEIVVCKALGTDIAAQMFSGIDPE